MRWAITSMVLYLVLTFYFGDEPWFIFVGAFVCLNFLGWLFYEFRPGRVK